MSKPGCLYVIATPIGNLEDITLRARRILAEVGLIAAEDTRHSQKLLQYLGLQTPMLPLHANNEHRQIEHLLTQLQAGVDIGLISDAGTPLISDPGGKLLTAVRQTGIEAIPVPGACAAIAALSVAGLPADRFYFVGFLSTKSGPRKQALAELKEMSVTLVFYEAPHRILEMILDMKSIFGEKRYAVIARELTKMYETVCGATLAELHDWLMANPQQQKGEFVIIVQGVSVSHDVDIEHKRILSILLEELSNKQAVSLAAKITGAKKNRLYKLALML